MINNMHVNVEKSLQQCRVFKSYIVTSLCGKCLQDFCHCTGRKNNSYFFSQPTTTPSCQLSICCISVTPIGIDVFTTLKLHSMSDMPLLTTSVTTMTSRIVTPSNGIMIWFCRKCNLEIEFLEKYGEFI